jgi:ATP-dependent DNA ligase
MDIMLRMRALPAGFIAPCLPTKTDKLPSGSQWLHEIKHDGFFGQSSARLARR